MPHPKALFGALITGFTLIAVLGGCARASLPASNPGESQMSPFKHIHGLAFDSVAGYGLAATHEGLYRFSLTGTTAITPAKVGEPQGGIRDDFMGLTSFESTLYASGHPGSTHKSSGPNLGLRQSTNAGVSWSSVSETSTADYHALTVGKDDSGRAVIYGLDTAFAGISFSVNGGRRWTKGAALAARDIVADPTLAKTVYATTQSGLLVSRDLGHTFSPVPNAPMLYILAAVPNVAIGSLIGIDVEGTVWLKPSALPGAALPWQKTGTVTGQANAIAFSSTTDSELLVSDQSGIALSKNLGATWRVVVSP